MKKVTFAIMGLGNRGGVYARQLQQFPDQMEVTAIADTRQSCLDTANSYLQLPPDRLFQSAEALLEQPKLADVMIVATQDAQHKEHAVRAMALGYDLLLEKPISNQPEEVKQITQMAMQLGRKVVVAHAMRYTPFYRKVKALLDEGAVGRILNVEAAEFVSCYHMAHAYVRGNWRRKDESSPIILAKCSHDMDLILWLTGKKCLSVSSVGSLDYFTKDNMPAGAPERCADGCPAEDCPYHAQRFYLSRVPGWPTNNMHPAPTQENIREILDTTRYGICVFRQDNDVVDHQQVLLQLEDNVTVSFSVNALHTRSTRTIRIGGTAGELWGDLSEKKLHLQKHGQSVEIFDLTDEFAGSGHQGGDAGLVTDMLEYFGGNTNMPSITTIDRSAESHYVAFAAEQSRLLGGERIDMKEFMKQERAGNEI